MVEAQAAPIATGRIVLEKLRVRKGCGAQTALEVDGRHAPLRASTGFMNARTMPGNVSATPMKLATAWRMKYLCRGGIDGGGGGGGGGGRGLSRRATRRRAVTCERAACPRSGYAKDRDPARTTERCNPHTPSPARANLLSLVTGSDERDIWRPRACREHACASYQECVGIFRRASIMPLAAKPSLSEMPKCGNLVFWDNQWFQHQPTCSKNNKCCEGKDPRQTTTYGWSHFPATLLPTGIKEAGALT